MLLDCVVFPTVLGPPLDELLRPVSKRIDANKQATNATTSVAKVIANLSEQSGNVHVNIQAGAVPLQYSLSG